MADIEHIKCNKYSAVVEIRDRPKFVFVFTARAMLALQALY